MSSLEELIRNKDVVFHSYGRDIDTDLKDFGEYNWDLVKHIADQSGNCIVMSGNRLYEHLKDVSNLYNLASFLVQLSWGDGTGKFREGISVHVDVDIDRFSEHYKKPASEKLINGLGQNICDTARWVPEIPYFEKIWNFALCQAVGGMVGYPGYEHPRDDASFRYEMASHAEHFMIGTKKQLGRYKKYALKHLQNIFRITDEMWYSNNKMFKDPYSLRSLEIEAMQARKIAENIQNFTTDYEKNDEEK